MVEGTLVSFAEYIELFSTYRQSICLSHDKLDVLLCNSIYKSKRFIRLFDIFCWSKMSRNCKAVMGSSNCGLSLLWIKQKSDCFFYLSGLREGDRHIKIPLLKFVPSEPKNILKDIVWRSGGEFPTPERCWIVRFNCNRAVLLIIYTKNDL